MARDKFWDTHTNITITAPKYVEIDGVQVVVAKDSKDGKELICAFFQFLVDSGLQMNMEQFERWEQVKAILEAA